MVFVVVVVFFLMKIKEEYARCMCERMYQRGDVGSYEFIYVLYIQKVTTTTTKTQNYNYITKN